MLRKIIEIDEKKCDGCGLCIPNCHEGALKVIDGKARLISDLFCDGLGACLGHCPTGALTVVEREAQAYDENKVMDYIVAGGPNVIAAHLAHLHEHGELGYFAEAAEYLERRGIENPMRGAELKTAFEPCGCPGSREMTFAKEESPAPAVNQTSELRQWPIQLHLVSPHAQYYHNSDLLLAADCCGFAAPNFHSYFLKGKSVAIACPKLDTNKQVYLDKLITMINESDLRSVTVLIMQVPCCGGLLALAEQAFEITGTEIPLNVAVISHTGQILQEERAR